MQLSLIGGETITNQQTSYFLYLQAVSLKNSGANISFISESLGHANIGVTKNYLSGFEKSERIKNAATLTNLASEPEPDGGS
jgi:integrase/recombinase XerD